MEMAKKPRKNRGVCQDSPDKTKLRTDQPSVLSTPPIRSQLLTGVRSIDREGKKKRPRQQAGASTTTQASPSRVSACDYQSEASVSWPAGVQAAAKVHWLIVGEPGRTLPS